MGGKAASTLFDPAPRKAGVRGMPVAGAKERGKAGHPPDVVVFGEHRCVAREQSSLFAGKPPQILNVLLRVDAIAREPFVRCA